MGSCYFNNYFGAAISPVVDQYPYLLLSINWEFMGLPTVNLDNNQHSPNENLRLGNYFRGIELFTTLLGTKFKPSNPYYVSCYPNCFLVVICSTPVPLQAAALKALVDWRQLLTFTVTNGG